jgi:hypothetical protein
VVSEIHPLDLRVQDPRADQEDLPAERRSEVEAVTRAVCRVDELRVLPQLVDEIEVAGLSKRGVGTEAGLVDGVRELIEHLRAQTDVIGGLVHRLERVTGEAVRG